MELGRKKESNRIKGYLKAGIFIAMVFFIIEVFALLKEIELDKKRALVEEVGEYYEFNPSGFFSEKARERFEVYTTENIIKADAVVYAEYLTQWASNPGVDILRLELSTFYSQPEMQVFTYLNTRSYENAWSDFAFPLKEGRWFQSNQDEVICINDSTYEISDTVILKDKQGEFFEATVVGKADSPYLLHNICMDDGLEVAISKYDNGKPVLLLNPQSLHNEKTDLINYGTTFIKSDNEAFISKISEYGTCTSVKSILIDNAPDFSRPIVTMIVCLFIATILLLFNFILR